MNYECDRSIEEGSKGERGGDVEGGNINGSRSDCGGSQRGRRCNIGVTGESQERGGGTNILEMEGKKEKAVLRMDIINIHFLSNKMDWIYNLNLVYLLK